MATIPNMRTWQDGELVTPQMLNEQLRDAINFLINPPAAAMQSSGAAKNITPVGSLNTTKYASVVQDTDNMADPIAGTITINTPGIYAIAGGMTFGAGSTNLSNQRVLFQVAIQNPNNPDPFSWPVVARADIATPLNNMSLNLSGVQYFSAGTVLHMQHYVAVAGLRIREDTCPTVFSVTWIGTAE